MIEGYCVKCKCKAEIQNPVEGKTKNGRKIAKGKCPNCGIIVCRLGGKKIKQQNNQLNKQEEKNMAKEKSKVGDVRPIYQQVGYEVCKTISDDAKDEKWVSCEKESEAEILSALLTSPKKEKKKVVDEDEDD